MCRRHSNVRSCGVCLKLKNLLKIHYKQFHTKYTVDISVSFKLAELLSMAKSFTSKHNIKHERESEQSQHNQLQSNVSLPELQSHLDFTQIKTETQSDGSDCQSESDAETICDVATGLSANEIRPSKSSPANNLLTLAVYDTAGDNFVPELYQNVRKGLIAKETVSNRYRYDGLEQQEFSCYCGKSFVTSRELNFHTKVHGMNQDPTVSPYLCVICDYRLQKQASLRDHKGTHGIYECYCGAEFGSRKELRCHKASHGRKPKKSNYSVSKRNADPASFPHACPLCEARYKDVATLRIHKLIHGIHECYCGRAFNGAEELANHKPCYMSRRSTPTTVSADKPHQCPICQRVFSRKFQIMRHIRNHSKENLYHCDCCDQTCATQRSLNLHLQTARHKDRQLLAKRTQQKTSSDPVVEKKNLPESNTSIVSNTSPVLETEGNTVLEKSILSTSDDAEMDVFRCEICLKTFESTDKLKVHIGSHCNVHLSPQKPEKSHLCETCGKKFDVLTKLHKHRQIHKSKNLLCPYCEFKTHNRHNLKMHIRAHTGEKPYTCEYCAKSFTEKGYLNDHVRIHTGEKPYKCKLCDYRAVQRGSLTIHVKVVHKKIRNYACTMCTKRFNNKSALDEHLKRHKGIKDVVCPLCDMRFVTKCELKGHSRSHSDARPYKCRFCNDAFKRAEHARSHMKTQHGAQCDALQTDLTVPATSSTSSADTSLHTESINTALPPCSAAYDAEVHSTPPVHSSLSAYWSK